MGSTTEGAYLGDALKDEAPNKFSREAVTVESGQDLAICAVVGARLKTIPTTGAADAGNTGDGTMTGVTGGEDTQLGTYTLTCVAVPDGAAVVPAAGTAGGGNAGDGTMTGVSDGGAAEVGTYTLTCISVPAGAAVVPATGTAGGGNTGDGTMTGVADGGAAQVGTYTLTCISVPDGAAVVPATGTAGGGNTGNGTMTGVSDGGDAQLGTYTLTCVNAAVSGSEIFQVVDPLGNSLPDATVGAAYTNAQLALTLNDGAVDFIVGDTFTVVVAAADHNAGTFQVVDPAGNELPNATVAVAYTNAQLAFTINDGATDFEAGDTFTVTVTAADHDSGTFAVLAPNGEALPDATVGTAYAGDQLNFTLNDGATDFEADDTFTVAVTAGTGKMVELDPDAVDGSQVAYGFLTTAVDASTADTAAVAIVRHAQVVTANLAWPAGITADEKAKAIAELKLLGIVARTEA